MGGSSPINTQSQPTMVRLIVKTSPHHSCFVSLPTSLHQTFLQGYEARSGNIVLEVAHAFGDNQEKLYVGWAGGASPENDAGELFLGIPQRLADCLDLSDGTVVDVSTISARPDKQVEVEPVTEDDWEVIELNAGYIEQHFLSQVNVLPGNNRSFPFWIHNKQVVFLTAKIPKDFAFVGPLSDLAVAPKVRRRAEEKSSNAPVRLAPSCFARVQPIAGDDVPRRALGVHPVVVVPAELMRRLRLSPGGPVVVTKVIAHDDALRSSSDSLPTSTSQPRADAPLPTSHRPTHKRACLARVASEESVFPSIVCDSKHVILSPSLMMSLRVEPCERVLLQGPTPKNVRLVDIERGGWFFTVQRIETGLLLQTSSSDTASLRDAFVDWLLPRGAGGAESGGGFPPSSPFPLLTSTCVVPLRLKGSASPVSVYCTLEQKANNTASSSSSSSSSSYSSTSATPFSSAPASSVVSGVVGTSDPFHAGVPLSFPPHYFCVDSVLKPSSPSPSSTTPESIRSLLRTRISVGPSISAPSSLSVLGTGAAGADATSRYLDSPKCVCLGARDNIVSSCARYLESQLLGSSSESGTTGTSGKALLLTGGRGSGKTSVAIHVAKHLHFSRGLLAGVEVVRCADWVNSSVGRVIDHLKLRLRVAQRKAPCALVLDDLDKLVPVASEQNVGLLLRSAQLSEAVCELFHQLYHRTSSVAIIATAADLTAVNSLFISSYVFGRISSLPELDQTSRSEVLRAVCENLGLGVDKKLHLPTIAALTDGYCCSDVVQLTQRASHFALARDEASGAGDAQPALTEADFRQALDGFVPAAMVSLPPNDSAVQWSDIGGLSATKEMLKETFELPTQFARLFANAPLKLRSGLMLYGPPGCGKTLLASAVAKECGLNFVSVKGPELLNKYIGASEQSVRDVFGRAAAAKPCILFFDEFEAIAPARGGESTGVTDRVVNQFLCHLDGVEGRSGVYVLAASSRPDLVDPALLRPGRLDKLLYCGFPDEEERVDILSCLLAKLETAVDVDISRLAAMTQNFSGADLQGVVSNAQIAAVHESLASFKADLGSVDSADKKDVAAPRIVITAAQLQTAVAETVLSVPEKERDRFDRIYSKFLHSKTDADTGFDPKGKQRSIAA